MRAARLLGAIGWIALALSGCGGSAAVRNTPPSCETRVPATHPADTVTVVVFDEIRPLRAPVPTNRAERFVFSHLYETLVNVDCRGVVRPGLAKSWKPGSDGWLVELRDGAQFWDQTKVAAEDIVRSFEPAIHAGLGVASVDPVDEHTVLIKGIHGPPDIKLLALPLVAIRNAWGSAGPPIGTGPWQFDTDIPFAEGIAIEPVVGSLGPVVRFIEGNPSDAKDLVAGKADAMITDDPATIEYAHDRHAALAPLAWDRAYVLIAPMRGSVTDLPQQVCDALARDAVRVDSRGGSNILAASWKASSTVITDDETPGVYPGNQLWFAADDPTARALAERIVALAAMDTMSSAEARAIRTAVPRFGPGLRAVPRMRDQMASPSPDANYVVALSWYADFPFLASSFYKRMPWLSGLGPRLSSAVLPLVETRAHFIAMNDHIGFTSDDSGDVRIMITGREQKR